MPLSRVAAASLASVFLAVLVIPALLHASSGFLLYLPNAQVCSIGEFQLTVATLHRNQTVHLAPDIVLRPDELQTALRERFKTRMDKVLLVKADGDVSFQDFLRFVDNAQPEVHRIVLITPGFQKDYLASCGDRL